MFVQKSQSSQFIAHLLGLLAGFVLLAGILAMAFVAGFGDEGAILGAAVMLMPLFAVALGSALARDERYPLGRHRLALPVAFGTLVAIAVMLGGTVLLRSLFAGQALWAPDSLLKGIWIVGACLVGAHAAAWLHGKRRPGASARSQRSR